MKYKMYFPAILLTLSILPSVTLGKMITVEPDDFEHGEDISNANESVTLNSISVNRETGEFEYDPVYAITAEECIPVHSWECDSDFVAPTGSKVFGFKDSLNRFQPGWGNVEEYYVYLEHTWAPFLLRGLMASFSRNTNYVSIKGITTQGSSDSNLLMGVSETGEVVATSWSDFSTAEFLCCDSEFVGRYWSYENSISTEGDDIAYIVVGGTFASNRLDHLTFNVSEPRIAPIFLVILGSLIYFRVNRGEPTLSSIYA